jgi:hypothetical protein
LAKAGGNLKNGPAREKFCSAQKKVAILGAYDKIPITIEKPFSERAKPE